MESDNRDTERLKQEISCRFREAREALHMTPPALAKAVGAAAQTIRDYENAKSIPGGEVLAGMANLGVNVDYVLRGKGVVIVVEGKTEARQLEAMAYGSRPPPVDSVLLQGVIEFFDAWMAEHQGEVRIDRDRHGAMISILYRIAAESGTIRKSELEQVLRLAA